MSAFCEIAREHVSSAILLVCFWCCWSCLIRMRRRTTMMITMTVTMVTMMSQPSQIYAPEIPRAELGHQKSIEVDSLWWFSLPWLHLPPTLTQPYWQVEKSEDGQTSWKANLDLESVSSPVHLCLHCLTNEFSDYSKVMLVTFKSLPTKHRSASRMSFSSMSPKSAALWFLAGRSYFWETRNILMENHPQKIMAIPPWKKSPIWFILVVWQL